MPSAAPTDDLELLHDLDAVEPCRIRNEQSCCDQPAVWMMSGTCETCGRRSGPVCRPHRAAADALGTVRCRPCRGDLVDLAYVPL